jgi:hypothetical protein
MTKEEKISLALSLIEQTRRDIGQVNGLDESLVTRFTTNLNLLEALITGRYESLVTQGEEVSA